MNGTIETETLNMTPEQTQDAVKLTEAIKARMSPPGALGLPPLLEARRLEYGLVDEMFTLQAVFDRIYIYQLEADWAQGECYPGTRIIRTDNTKARQRREAPVGIVVSAGLLALDQMRAHGIDLGHKVAFVRLSPWEMPIAMVDTKEIKVMMMRAGDLLGGFDMADARITGRTKIHFDEETQQHLHVDESGRKWASVDPTKNFEE